jgi:hypothetical protein
MTERVDQNNTWSTITIADQNQASSGATGTRTAVVTTAEVNVGHLAAFKQAAAGGDPEGSLIRGKLLRGGLLRGGVLVR